MIYHTTDFNSVEPTYGNFKDLGVAVNNAVALCEPHVDEFDCIVVMGVSGMCIGFPLALALKKDIAVLRKADEKSHSLAGTWVGVPGTRCLFVDDFVSMGETRAIVSASVESLSGRKVVAQYLERDNAYTLL